MGLCVSLETENGDVLKIVSDDRNILHRLLPAPGSSNEMIANIDWYGDTTFNALQMKQFLREWDGLIHRTSTELTLLGEIKELALRCQEEVHVYLKFIGD